MKNKPTPHGSDQQLRDEVERLRLRLSELESSLDESQRTIDSIQKSEQLYRGLLENIPTVTYAIEIKPDPAFNRATYVSPQVEKVTGYSVAEFFNDPLLWAKLIHPEDQARVMAESDLADQTGGLFMSEYRIITKENKTFWLHDESVLFKAENGQPLYRLGVWMEVTERKLSEIARQLSEDLYRRAIVSAGAVPYVLDHSTHTLTFIGEGILAMTGYSASEMMNSNQWNSVVEKGFPRGNLAHLTYEEADRLTEMDKSIPWECDFRIRTRDGQVRWVADTSVKSYDEKSQHMLSIGIKQDITERKHAEEMQENLIHELERRNAELERLAYTLSHELKSPLITIRGFLGYLREDAVSGNVNRLERDIQRIKDGSDKMLRLINELIDLMSVGRIAQDFREIPLRLLVDEAVELVHEKIVDKNIAVHIADNLPRVFGDPKRLLEVLQNLLENSIKFMGGQPEPRIEIGQRMGQDAEPIFFVRDNGIGIEPRFNERIFGIFHKLDAESEGTGIGLALVKRIIEMHGGIIWVESDGLGKGSTFCFTIPKQKVPDSVKDTI